MKTDPKVQPKTSLRKKAAALKAAITLQDNERAAREAEELEEGLARLHAEVAEHKRLEDARLLKEVADEATRQELAAKSPWQKFLDWF